MSVYTIMSDVYNGILGLTWYKILAKGLVYR